MHCQCETEDHGNEVKQKLSKVSMKILSETLAKIAFTVTPLLVQWNIHSGTA